MSSFINMKYLGKLYRVWVNPDIPPPKLATASIDHASRLHVYDGVPEFFIVSWIGDRYAYLGYILEKVDIKSEDSLRFYKLEDYNYIEIDKEEFNLLKGFLNIVKENND